MQGVGFTHDVDRVDLDRIVKAVENRPGEATKFRGDLPSAAGAPSVQVARHTVSSALHAAGVEPTCVDEVNVALSEACTNAVLHAVGGVTYEVMVGISDEQVAIEVIDSGSGFGQRDPTPAAADHAAENGRGTMLMNALSDLAVFDSVTGKGGSVHLTKRLRWIQGARQPTPAQSVERPR